MTTENNILYLIYIVLQVLTTSLHLLTNISIFEKKRKNMWVALTQIVNLLVNIYSEHCHNRW